MVKRTNYPVPDSMDRRRRFSFRLGALVAAIAALTPCVANAEAVREDDPSLGKELNLPICKWQHPAVQPKGIILALHGVTLHAKRFETVGKKLAANGYPVYALDLRGFGRWRTENEKFNGDNKIHYTQSQDDLVRVLTEMRKKYPETPIYLMGESLGANLSVWAASTHSDLIDGIILSSPCVKRIIRLNPRVMLDATKGLFKPYSEFGLEPHIKPYLSEDPRVTEEYLADPVIDKEMSPADLIKSVKTNVIALAQSDKIPEDMPILMLVGEQDRIYKAKAIPKFAKKIPSKEQTIYVFENKGHLLLEHNYVQPDVLAKLDEWLEGRHKRKLEVKGTIAEHDANKDNAYNSSDPSGSGSGGASRLSPITPATIRPQ